MQTAKLDDKAGVARKNQMFRMTQTESISGLSKEVVRDFTSIFETWIKAGMSSTFHAYAADIVLTDFLWAAGLITDRAYNAVFVLETIFQTSATLTALFGGGGALASQLKTLTEARKGDDEKSHDEEPEEGYTEQEILGLVTMLAGAAV